MGLAVDSAQILALPSLNSICRPGPGSVARLRFVCLNSRPRWDAVSFQRLALLMLYLTGTGTAMHPESATLESRVSIRVACERADSAGCLARQKHGGGFSVPPSPKRRHPLTSSHGPSGTMLQAHDVLHFAQRSRQGNHQLTPKATLLCRVEMVGTWQWAGSLSRTLAPR